jgi:hypothetical protein
MSAPFPLFKKKPAKEKNKIKILINDKIDFELTRATLNLHYILQFLINSFFANNIGKAKKFKDISIS